MSPSKLTFFLIFKLLITIVLSSTPQISVNKCCNIDEELLIDKKPTNNVVCIKTNAAWAPFYYDKNSTLANKIVRELPKTWIVNSNKVPVCSDDNVIEIIVNRVSNPIILWNNGGVILGGGESFYQPNTFCADKNALIVCVPKKNYANQAASTIRPRIHRCCRDNAVFSNERLVFIFFLNYNYLLLIIN